MKNTLRIFDCPGASEADRQRGIDAAEAVFSAANLTAEHCARQIEALAEGDDYGEKGVAAWKWAEAAAIEACCAGWVRIPASAYLELQ